MKPTKSDIEKAKNMLIYYPTSNEVEPIISENALNSYEINAIASALAEERRVVAWKIKSALIGCRNYKALNEEAIVICDEMLGEK
jgi:hypothetical protein